MTGRSSRVLSSGLIFIGLSVVVFLWWGGSPDYFPRWFQSWRFAFQESRAVRGTAQGCRAFRAGSGFVQLKAHRMDYRFVDANGAARSEHSYSSGACPGAMSAVKIEYLANRPDISRIRGMRRVRWGHGLNSVMLGLVFLSGAFFGWTIFAGERDGESSNKS